MKRYFGSVSYNHKPIEGYRQVPQPQFYSERGNVPLPERQHVLSKQLIGAGIARHLHLQPEADSFSQELGNPDLPIYPYSQEIIDSVQQHPVTIVVGETGSGKSTQIPQMLLGAGYEHVYLTQPRRIASYLVAERMQQELDGTLGSDWATGMVGYQTAEHSTIGPDTKVCVLTDGIEHAKQLNDMPTTNREVHIMDEVHEWNTNIELSVGLIKRRLASYPDERFVLTSATMDAHRLAAHFAEVTGEIPPVIEVPGREHQIVRYEKPDSTVIDEVVMSAVTNPDEDILVFVPGKREIADTIDAIRRRLPPSIARTTTLLPLHAKLVKEEQDRINLPAPALKIIIATNVAQTSLTIEGIDVVIDSGLERHVELDDEGVEGLNLYPCSQADCDQRAGRTGRVGPGTYILTRYDAHSDYVPYIARQKFPKAEILRTDIDRTTLRTLAAGIDLAELSLFHPVDRTVIWQSHNSLQRLGALDENGQITTIGMQMNQFPVRPSSARMLVETYNASPQVRAYVSAIVASLEVGGLPYFAHDAGKAWIHLTDETSSDMLAQLDIFIAAQTKTNAQLAELDLDVQNIRRAQELHRKIVRRSRAYDGELITPSESERQAIRAAIYTGLADWVYRHTGSGNYQHIGEGDHILREISNRSVVAGHPRLIVGSPYRVEYMKNGESMERHIIENVTAIEDPRVLGKVAMHLCDWLPDRTLWRDGKLKQVLRLKFNSVVDLGSVREVDARSTPENRQRLIDMLLEQPGAAQQELRVIKKQLEELQHLTVAELPKITQDDLIGFLKAAMGAELLETDHVDTNLRLLMQQRNISLDTYISSTERQKIRDNAPGELTLGSQTMSIVYRQGRPIVRQYSRSAVMNCTGDVCLPDGRPVWFVYENHKLLRAPQLQQVMQAE